jgi:hypothetical protein
VIERAEEQVATQARHEHVGIEHRHQLCHGPSPRPIDYS